MLWIYDDTTYPLGALPDPQAFYAPYKPVIRPQGCYAPFRGNPDLDAVYIPITCLHPRSRHELRDSMYESEESSHDCSIAQDFSSSRMPSSGMFLPVTGHAVTSYALHTDTECALAVPIQSHEMIMGCEHRHGR